MDTQPFIGQQERIDDVPLLIGMMGRMKLAEVLDKHLGRHHLHLGLSNGQLAVGWIAYILSQSDHRKYAVQDWAEGLSHTLESLFGCSLRPHEFSDDRLGILRGRGRDRAIVSGCCRRGKHQVSGRAARASLVRGERKRKKLVGKCQVLPPAGY